MEKAIKCKNQPSRFLLIASLSALIWFILFFFNYVLLYHPPSVDHHVKLHSSRPLHIQSLNRHSRVSHRMSNQSPALKTPIHHHTQPNLSLVRTNENQVSDVQGRNTTNNDNHRLSNILVQNVSDKHQIPRVQVHNVSTSIPFMKTAENKSDPCGSRYIYVHDLPPKFNKAMLKECRSLSLWTNMCKFTTNAGLGPPLENAQGVFSNTGWYATNQFAIDTIFHNRMKQYECLTKDSSIAAAVFVPFYAGLDISRYLWGYNISVRDAASLELVDWVTKRPEWSVMGGKDHFLVGGRITWDFRRQSEHESDWGNKLLFLPAAKNMSMLVVESSPWNANDFGIPYPTYFHPAHDVEVFDWQERMRKLSRPWLFSFAGAPRPGSPTSIRGRLIEQCRNSKFGKLLECGFGESKCHSPSSVMKMFQSSQFCLQPPGDSYTRRSAFDAILAGCIPVFFHPGSAYTQYTWHLPKNYSNYSVLISEDGVRNGSVSIEETLRQISAKDVKMMRENVVSLIPRLIYADPRSRLETIKDAFDVAVEAIIHKVSKLRKDIAQGLTDNRSEENSWKYELVEEGQPHEWDPLFSRPGNGNNVSTTGAAKNSSKDQRDAS